MANIPGTNGYQQPGIFVRDRTISRGSSTPGGVRIPCIMGEGLREETVVSSAVGGGEDGDGDCSPTGEGEGRYFSLKNVPVIEGRTQLYLNGTLLYGIENATTSTFTGEFDYNLTTETGCIELQSASIGDQDGQKYSASTLNIGDGTIVDGTCGDFDLISIIDENAPQERWTVRCIGVSRDSNGDPIPGLATFTASGSVSGQLRNSSGQPYLFHSSYYTGSSGAVSGSADACTDGFIVASSGGFGEGGAVLKAGDASSATTDQFEINGDLVTQGQVLVGDSLCVDGYVGIEIEDIEYNSDDDITTLTLKTDSLDMDLDAVPWEIRATNLFIDDESVLHNAVTGLPATAGSFTSSDLGKVLMICSGDATGKYRVTKVTSSRRLRVESLDDADVGFPSLADDDSDGLSGTGLTFHMLETNGVLLFGIQEDSVSFEVGDKFFIDVNSRVLKENDTLEARYIAEADINDPEYFTSAADLQAKHGRESTVNTLTLAAKLAFENGAPGILAVQCKPALPRRTTATLIAEVEDGEGGFAACAGGNCEVDDLLFPIPRPLSGLGTGRPDGDTQVHIFITRDGDETQIFPNKVGFYDSSLESAIGQTAFIDGASTTYSYTIINTETKITGQGYNGDLIAADGTFGSTEVDFDAADVGRVIVIQSVESSVGTVYTESDDISTFLFGSTTPGIELVITGIVDDNTVTVTANDDDNTEIIVNGVDIQFFIKDEEDTTNVRAALLLHSSLVDNGTIQEGDGIRISYIDESDADFFDTNWFEAFEALEAADCQIIVPVPTQNRFGIFRAAVSHVETMSSIAIQKERVTFFGAQMGVSAAALIGTEEIAIEDIGVIEGLQGDSAEEVLDGNTEDLVNMKVSDNYTSNRSMYFFPGTIVRSIAGSATSIDGFYLAACAAGYFAGTQNIAIPLTNKVLTGFSILREHKYRPVILNALGSVGATVLQPVTGGGLVLAGRTTSQSGYVEDEEISVMFIRDHVKEILRGVLRPFIGQPESANTPAIMMSKVKTILAGLVSKGLITGFSNIKVERDKVDPRQWNVYLRFIPTFPINYIFCDIEVGIS